MGFDQNKGLLGLYYVSNSRLIFFLFGPLNSSTKIRSCSTTGWILNVLRRDVLDLEISFLEEQCKIFVSKTLVKLKLGPGYCLSFTIYVEDVFLPKLKSLCLDSVVFEEDGVGFTKLLSECPVLEELVLMNIGWDYWKSCSVSIKTLKRLTFFCEDTNENPKSVSFDTPNLEYLEYSDTIADKYPKVNCSTTYDYAVFELSKKIQKILKIASRKCQIQVIS